MQSSLKFRYDVGVQNNHPQSLSARSLEPRRFTIRHAPKGGDRINFFPAQLLFAKNSSQPLPGRATRILLTPKGLAQKINRLVREVAAMPIGIRLQLLFQRVVNAA